MTNINYSNEKVNPFSGVFFCKNSIEKKKIAYLIDKTIGKRVKQAKYSYSDILLSWTYSNLCGAERLEDVNLKMRNYFNFPSPDRIAGVFKTLTQPDKTLVHNVDHQFNINLPLNGLMLDIANKLKVIKGTTLDYDNTIIENRKKDSKTTYQLTKGYQPGVCFIDKIPVYIEGRGGNSPASYKIDHTVLRSLYLLDKKNIKIKRFRSDAAAYNQNLISELDKRDIEFFIRAPNAAPLMKKVKLKTKWRLTKVNKEVVEVSNSSVQIDKIHHRIVMCKKLYGAELKCFSIITNNISMTEEEVIRFYNKRGAIEKNFDMLKNDFNWKRLPFSKLSENTVFMIVSAIGSIIFQYLIKSYARKVKFVKRKFRLKNFIYHFIVVSGIMEGDTLTLFTDRVYLE